MPASLTSAWPPWVVMWALSVAIFTLCKWVTWHYTPAQGVPAWRQLAYLIAWPGMDARAFLTSRVSRDPYPRRREWVFAASKMVLGAGLLWAVVPLVPNELGLLRGWVGMAGLIFLLHFGSFHLLSCVWRAAGIDARPIMNWPVLAESLSEFWGKRWNLAFRDLTHRFLFRPLANRFGPRTGLLAGFLFSGIVHDVVISLPAGGGYGLPTLYFVIQGLGLLVERSKAGQRVGLGGGWRGRSFTAVVVIGPAGGLFHPPFVLGVILPFLGVIGAN